MFKIFVLFQILAIGTAFKINGRITGGIDARPHEAPFMVSFQVRLPDDKFMHSCGGSIINKNWILTAAHCVHPEQIKGQRVVAGRHNITKDDEITSQSRTIEYYKTYPKYEGGPTPFDIALLYVKEPFTWNTAVQPVNLPEPFSEATGTSFLYGWGVISRTFESIRPDILQTTHMPIISNKACQKAFGSYPIDPTNLCTGSTDEGLAACSSDSGGPLVQRGHLQRDTQIGVVSWGGSPCGKVGTPSVFVKVSHFIDWINEVIVEYERSL